MLVMRPAQMADLNEVQRLAADSPIGVTSLPDDLDRLRDKIAASEASFAAEVSFNGEESYFFVLEDTSTGKLVGCSAIVASAGYSEPFYSFRNETFVHASRELKIHNKIHVLSQCHDLTGNSLLTSFYVVPELVGTAWSELNSRGRLLFVANHPERFADSVVTEIVGYSDEQGDSPFWDAIGRNFFDLNYAAAERLCGLKSRTFLAELMPHYPIYVPLLPDTAQEAMQLFKTRLEKIGQQYGVFTEVRGLGLLIGCVLSDAWKGRAKDIFNAAEKENLMILQAGPDVVRFAPSLVVEEADITEGLDRFERAVKNLTA